MNDDEEEGWMIFSIWFLSF